MRPAFHNNVTKRYRGGTARKTLEARGGRARGRLPDLRLRRREPLPAVVGRPRLLRQRSRRHDEPVVDGRKRPRPPAAHAPQRLGRPRPVARPRARRLPGGRRPVALRHRLGQRSGCCRSAWPPTSTSSARSGSKKPMEYLTSVHLHPKGDAVVLTARGRVFVAPAAQGRLVRASREPGVRYRDVGVPARRQAPRSALSDATGELEFATLPANGVGAARRPHERRQGPALRGRALARRPVGRLHRQQQRPLAAERGHEGADAPVARTARDASDVAWSPDSRFLAWSQARRRTASTRSCSTRSRRRLARR